MKTCGSKNEKDLYKKDLVMPEEAAENTRTKEGKKQISSVIEASIRKIISFKQKK